ncbi:SusC/RagA family TonB-linked outer membrane protein [Prevotella sp. 10(H)]|uniref:SusC/RagA family TonB-linked outer membrane protein n=1 Tax=Prevotella sp. 10(H) TaxID=1158294 RepID=UPI0004A6F07C|nr:SusC/RagA family TonB-linked outer membrane protein [Prevotella sp. 10(H)]
MKKRVMLILSCLFLSIGFIVAQTTRISGVVVDNNGEPVISASVVVKGTTVGTVTGLDGEFSINVPSGNNTLVFTLVGMKPVEAKPVQGMKVVMENDEQILADVVVTALGISRDAKALGYGSTTIKNDEITAAKSGSLMSGLVGKVAGVNISTTGATGTSQKVIVRGFSSFSENQPLYIVDGVPIQNTFSGNKDTNNSVDFGNLAGDINPDDVESVTVLKGASATALYGTRAASGVIMITTKKAQKNQKPTITYSGTFSASNVLRAPQTQDMFGQGWPLWDNAENGSWGPKLDGRMHEWGAGINGVLREKPFTYVKDNVKKFYETGFEMNNNISYAASGEHTGIMISYGNLTSDGIIPSNADKYTRNTISFRGNTVYDKLNLSYNINYSRKHIKAVSAGQGSDGAALFQEVLQNPVDINLQDLKDLNNPYNSPDNYYTWYAENPYWVIANNGNEYTDNHTYGNIDVSYELIPGLKAIGRLGGDFNDSRRKAWNGVARFAPGSYSYGHKSNAEGSYLEHNESRTQLEATGLLDANYTLSEDFSLSGMVGWNYNYRDLNLIDSYLYGLNVPGWYSLENGSTDPATYSRKYQRRLYGALAQAELGYRNYLYLTLSGRNDWSSTLPKDNRSFFYWGANASLIVTDMVPSIKNDILNYLKVRLAYGKTGKDANWYLISNEYQPTKIILGFGNLNFPLNGVPGLTMGNTRGNDNLKPEITREAEFGFDLRLFDSRLTVDFAYYDRNTKDQIIAATQPFETGYSLYTRNVGEIQNRGVEVSLGIVPVRTKDWNWNLGVTFAKNNSEVKKLWEVDGKKINEYVLTSAYQVDFVAEVGKPLGVFKVPKVQRSEDGRIVVSSSSGLPLIVSGEKEEVGTSAPDFTMGFVNRVTWKNLTFGAVIDWRSGGEFWSNTAEMMTWNGNATATMYNERQPFVVPNSVKLVGGKYVDNDVPVTWENTYAYYNHSSNYYMYRDFILPKGYVKLREVSLTYNFPKNLISKLGIVKELEVAVIGRNLLMWTPKANNFVDPEATNYGNDITSELGEFTAAPTTRSIGGSIKVTF